MRKSKRIELRVKDLEQDIKNIEKLNDDLYYANNWLRNEISKRDREKKFQEICVEESLNKDKLIKLYKPIVHNSKMMAVNELETIKIYILEGEKDIIKLIDKEIERLKGE